MTITTTKRQVEVTVDNFWDLFLGDYAVSLANGLSRDEDGELHLHNDSQLVTRLVAWVKEFNNIEEGKNWYTIDRVTAAMILCESAPM